MRRWLKRLIDLINLNGADDRLKGRSISWSNRHLDSWSAHGVLGNCICKQEARTKHSGSYWLTIHRYIELSGLISLQLNNFSKVHEYIKLPVRIFWFKQHIDILDGFFWCIRGSHDNKRWLKAIVVSLIYCERRVQDSEIFKLKRCP